MTQAKQGWFIDIESGTNHYIGAIDITSAPRTADPNPTSNQIVNARVVRSWSTSGIKRPSSILWWSKGQRIFIADSHTTTFNASSKAARLFTAEPNLAKNLDTSLDVQYSGVVKRANPRAPVFCRIVGMTAWYDSLLCIAMTWEGRYWLCQIGNQRIDNSTAYLLTEINELTIWPSQGHPQALFTEVPFGRDKLWMMLGREINGKVRPVFQQIARLGTSGTPRIGNEIVPSGGPSNLDPHAGIMEETSALFIDPNTAMLYETDLSAGSSAIIVPVGAIPANRASITGMTRRVPLRTLIIEGDVPKKSLNGNEKITFVLTLGGNARGPVDLHASATKGSISAIANVDNTEPSTIDVTYVAPSSKETNVVLKIRVVRDGRAINKNLGPLSISPLTFEVQINSGEAVSGENDQPIKLNGFIVNASSVFPKPKDWNWQWHEGTPTSAERGGYKTDEFSTPTSRKTEWKNAESGIHPITVFATTTLEGENYSGSATAYVRVGRAPSGGGSGDIQNFVYDDDPLANIPPVDREIPGHPYFIRIGKKQIYPIWVSRRFSLPSSFSPRYLFVDAEWNTAEGEGAGSVQILLYTGDRKGLIAGQSARILWVVTWKAGSEHYARGRIFIPSKKTLKEYDLINGRSILVKGSQVSLALQGSKEIQRFPFEGKDFLGYGNPNTEGHYKTKIQSSHDMIPISLPIMPACQGFQLWVVTNIPVKSVHLGDDLYEAMGRFS